MFIYGMQRKGRGRSSFLLLLLTFGAVLVAGGGQPPTTSWQQQHQHQHQQQQQAHCLALLTATYPTPSSSSESMIHADICLRLAHLFAPAALASSQSAPLYPMQQQWWRAEEHHQRFPSSSSFFSTSSSTSSTSSSSSFFSSPSSSSSSPSSSSFPPFSLFSFAWPHTEATSGGYATFKDPDDIVNLCVAFACVLCAAMAAGLTIGLMSIDPLELEIKQRVGTVEECRQASVVLPLIQRHHYLLVTLLLYNSAANETLPLFLDKLVPSYVAVLLSVTLVLIFGEILPSALFSGPNQLKIAARMASFVWFLMLILSPISYPLAWLLDRCFGSHNPRKRYNRAELSALIEIHQEVKRRNITILPSGVSHPVNGSSSNQQAPHYAHMSASSATSARAGLLSISHHPGGGRGGGKGENAGSSSSSVSSGRGQAAGTDAMLSQDEVDIVVGVLKIASKTVQDCLVPMDKAFCLSTRDELDGPMLAMIMSSGFSRIPVYDGADPSFIRGFLLVKRLIVLDPASRRRVGTLSLRQPLVVSPLCPLIDLLNAFQEGRSHLALVSAEPHLALDCITQGRPLKGGAAPLGLITLEDVIEEILQEEILDEHDRTREELERRRQRGAKQVLSASLLRKEGREPPSTNTSSSIDFEAPHTASASASSSSSSSSSLPFPFAASADAGTAGTSSTSSTSCIQQQVVVDLTLHSMAQNGTVAAAAAARGGGGGSGGRGMSYRHNAPSSPAKWRTQQQPAPSIYTSYPSYTAVLPLLQQQQQQEQQEPPKHDRPRHFVTPDPSLSRQWQQYHQLQEGGEGGKGRGGGGGGGPVPKHQRAVSADADSSRGHGGSGSQKGGGGGGGGGGRDGWREMGGGGEGGPRFTRSRSTADPAEMQQLPWSSSQQGLLQPEGGSSQSLQQQQQQQQQQQCRPIPEDGVGAEGSARKEERRGGGLTEPLLRSVDSQF